MIQIDQLQGAASRKMEEMCRFQATGDHDTLHILSTHHMSEMPVKILPACSFKASS